MSTAERPEPAEAILREGRAVLTAAAACLRETAEALDDRFVCAARMILSCKGLLVVSGIGKAGQVAQKVSSTFASTGTPSIYLHPTDALHGDLGRVGAGDVFFAFSNSGASAEILRLLQPVRGIGAPLLALTADPESPLAREADVCLCYAAQPEAGHLGLAPTTSTTAMLAVGDALAMAVLSRRGFSQAEFARFHPGGSLGRSLLRVGDVMRRGDANPVIREDLPLSHALRLMSATPGRPGAISVVDARGALVGFYTDGDFRRRMESAEGDGRFDFLHAPVRDAMTRSPLSIAADRLVAEAGRVMRERKVDQLPVVDDAGTPIGLLDVQDLLDVKVLG